MTVLLRGLLVFEALVFISGCTAKSNGGNPSRLPETVQATPSSAVTPTPQPSIQPSPQPSTSPRQMVRTGRWGGAHSEMNVTPVGAHVEFGCWSGDAGEPLVLDGNSHFDVNGTAYTLYPGGPTPQHPPRYPARFEGSIRGNAMNLTIHYLRDGAWNDSSYTLVYGVPRSGTEMCPL